MTIVLYFTSHSVLGAILTLEISRVMETLVFGSEWVVGITLYVHFCPIPQPPSIIFSQYRKLHYYTLIH